MAHILAPIAEADLEAIWLYVATESGETGAADRLVDALTSRFYLLSAYPRLGRSREDLRPGLRSFSVSGYIIFYRLNNVDDVLIVSVRHGRQDTRNIGGLT